jgi:hypothetical protein
MGFSSEMAVEYSFGPLTEYESLLAALNRVNSAKVDAYESRDGFDIDYEVRTYLDNDNYKCTDEIGFTFDKEGKLTSINC